MNGQENETGSEKERDIVLSARDVTVGFGSKIVLDNLNLDIYRGEILGFVGASGTGKSVLMRTILRLLPRQSGTIEILGQNFDELNESERNSLDMRLGVLFQQGALFSSLTVKENIQVPMREYLDLPKSLMDELAHLKIKLVGLAADAADKYPSELSGGMIKRAALARALALDPDVLVADEAVSALDVSVQAQVLNLMQDLQEQFGLSYILISHDLAVVDYLCDEVAVMYLGRVVEQGRPEDLFEHCAHPYTRALLDAVPRAQAGGGRRRRGAQAIASQSAAATGCPYVARCPLADQHCREVPPLLRRVGEGHLAACHKAEAVMALPQAAMEG